MAIHIRRREFIVTLGSAAAAWPLAARAQQLVRMRRIGVLMGTVETAPDAVGLKTVLDRLQALGWAQGVTARIEILWSRSDSALMRENARALMALSPEVILCHSNPALAQLRPVSTNTPIVFVMVADPVGSGFVNSLSHPGGNITGFTNFEASMGGKWVEMLKEIAPQITRVGVLMHPETAAHLAFRREAEAAALNLNIEPYALGIHTAEEIENAVMSFAVQPGGGLVSLRLPDRRASTALSILLSWIAENFPESVRISPRPSDGLDQMAVGEEGRGLFAEVRAGAQVGEAFFMFMTADNSIAFEQDKAVISPRGWAALQRTCPREQARPNMTKAQGRLDDALKAYLDGSWH